MKRNNGGYVLAYVVVVIVILCIIVPIACSSSLQNLKAQQASVERMRQLYTAEGQIERFVAEVRSTALDIDGDGCSDPDTAKSTAKNKFTDAVTSIANLTLDDPANFLPTWNGDQCAIISKAASVTVMAEFKVTLDIEVKAYVQEGTPAEEVTYYSYEITSCTLAYESYDISTTTESEPEGGGDAE